MYPTIYPDAGRLAEARTERYRDHRLVAASGKAGRRSLCFIRNHCGRPITITPPRTRSTPAGIVSMKRSLQPGASAALRPGNAFNENTPQVCRAGSAPTRSRTRGSRSIRSIWARNACRRPAGPRSQKSASLRPAAVEAKPGKSKREEYALVSRLDELSAVEYPEDQELPGRGSRATNWPFALQSAVPEAIVDFAQETEAIRRLYGIDNDATKLAGEAACWRPGG